MLPKIPGPKPNSPRAPTRELAKRQVDAAAAASPPSPRGAKNAPAASSTRKKPGAQAAAAPVAATAAAAAAAAVAPPPTRRIPRALEQQLLGLARDEDAFRSNLELQEVAAQSQLSLTLLTAFQHPALRDSIGDIDATTSKLRRRLDDHTARDEEARLMARATHDSTLAVATRVEDFFAHLESSEKRLFDETLLENRALKAELAERARDAERQAAELQCLRDQLGRKLLRTVVESDALRMDVRREIERARLEVDALKSGLHERIDAAVLAFQQPSQASALRALRERAAEAQQAVQSQCDALHSLVDAIGAQDRLLLRPGESASGDATTAAAAATTMHSNFPALYRSELGKLSREQLLNMLDVVSFEEGVVEGVGKALYARQRAVPHRQHVFT